jgi:hypothetical protein
MFAPSRHPKAAPASMSSPLASSQPGIAVVVFADDASCWWLRPLARGFRHCFVVLRREHGWWICDPLKTGLVSLRVPAGGWDPLASYVRRGHRVLLGPAPRVPPRAPHGRRRGRSCVGVVKRVLGIRAPLVRTPRQLHAYLTTHPPQPFIEIREENLNVLVDSLGI